MFEVAEELEVSPSTIGSRMDDYGIERKTGRTTDPCTTCGANVERLKSEACRTETQFCSTECRNSWLSESRQGEDNPSWGGGKVDTECSQCGTGLRIGKARFERTDRHFCSDCWGQTRGAYGKGWWKNRNAVRERDNGICQNCLSNSERPYDVHHIVPHRKFDSDVEANKMENLVLLCHSCHVKLEKIEPDVQREILNK